MVNILKPIRISLLLGAIGVFVASCKNSSAETGRDWFQTSSGRQGEWVSYGDMSFPSGRIFIGDPSRGSDYHMRGARALPTDRLTAWLYVEDAANPKTNRVHTVWLAASDKPPVKTTSRLSFGTDSAYFAFGDEETGHALSNIGDLGIPELPDSFEFFLPHILNYGFVGLKLEVPPNALLAFAVETKRDGGLEAVWTEDRERNFSGILIDISGRAEDGLYLDKLIGG